MGSQSLYQTRKAVALEYILSKESNCLPWIKETKLLNPMELLLAQMAIFMFAGVAVIVFVFLVQRVNFCYENLNCDSQFYVINSKNMPKH